ncbi:LuxR C-terminal-related transcriptional regulator [Sandaracinobacteroides saxicola]|uniref:AAA family ATPase n=1 Tax=Sandaracinobacteroides saxicola TaxID=2759707 RepID=A0A7G5IFL6_9SPHN|nr:LuxR C-terminal-related transcriptional regulator [Sandaracinobacteroides saxicola]QMW22158.1 AAA family ATPase [Sandaracinobacteroides saxicola]
MNERLIRVVRQDSHPETAPTAGHADFVGRIAPPRQHVATAVRPALLDRLDAGLVRPVSLILSPAGFGKTTLLSQWFSRLRQDGRVAAGWMSLDADDSGAVAFILHLVTAIADAGIALDAPSVPAMLQAGRSGIDAELFRMLDALAESKRRLVLIIDDCHLGRAELVDQLLTRVVQHPRANVHLALGSRERPGAISAQWMARGLVALMGPTDLALDDAGLAEIFGDTLDAGAREILLRRTEGWPVAVQLARLWLSQDSAHACAIDAFGGRSGEMARYLLEQVLAGLPPELIDFLTATSILDRFDARLADAVRDAADSQQLIERLRPFEAFLLPLDAARSLFRYHHLIADYLQLRLEATDVAKGRILRQRAARQLATDGHLVDAVRQARKAGDTALAIELIANAGGWELVIPHGPPILDALLAEFDDPVIAQSPVLLLMRAYQLNGLGDVVMARVVAECAGRFDPSSTRQARDQLVVSHILDAYADDIYRPQWRAAFPAALDSLDRDDHFGRGALLNNIAASDTNMGALESAEAHARHSIIEMTASGQLIGRLHAEGTLAQSLFFQGRLTEAEALLRDVMRAGADRNGPGSVIKDLVAVLIANIAYWRDEQTEARALLAESLDRVEAYDGWVDIYDAAFRTSVALDFLNSGLDAAMATIDRARALARRRQSAVLAELALAWRLEVLIIADQHEAAAAVVKDEGIVERQRVTGLGWRPGYQHGVALTQWYLKTERPSAALPLLRDLRTHAAFEGRRMHLARIDTMQAAAHHRRGDTPAMLTALARAARFLEAEYAPRALLDTAAPIEAMLSIALSDTSRGRFSANQRMVLARLLEHVRSRQGEPKDGLSSRELSVLQQLCAGHGNKRIAWALGMSENTVKFHLKRIYAKLGTDTRHGAVAAAIARGLRTPSYS